MSIITRGLRAQARANRQRAVQAQQPVRRRPAVAAYPRAPSARQVTAQARQAAALPVATVAIPAAAIGRKPAGPQPYRGADFEITGGEALDYMRLILGRYVHWSSDAALDATCLWALHTYARYADGTLIWAASPRLFMLGKKGCGKSTVLRMLARICPRVYGIETGPTAYGLISSIGAEKPTLLIDEAGILVGDGGKRKADVQEILLNGYAAEGTKLWEHNKKCERVQLFAPVALAGLDVVEKTMNENVEALLDRAIRIRMSVAPADAQPHDIDEEEDELAPRLHRLRMACAGWVLTNRDYLASARPEPAEGAIGRWRQIWRPLLALADAAGGTWPERARAACKALQQQEGQEDGQEMAGFGDELQAMMAGFR